MLGHVEIHSRFTGIEPQVTPQSPLQFGRRIGKQLSTTLSRQRRGQGYSKL